MFWGFGFVINQPGNLVKKPMAECSGREIRTEIMGHLRLSAETDKVLAKAICIPCIMPFIISQLLPRSVGDGPASAPSMLPNSRLHWSIERDRRRRGFYGRVLHPFLKNCGLLALWLGQDAAIRLQGKP